MMDIETFGTKMEEFLGKPLFTHLEFTWWHHAPLPRRWHRCSAWSFGVIDGRQVARCACGGIRIGRSDKWTDKNSRRKMKR